MVTLACAIVVLAGCDKLKKKHEPDPEPVGSNEPPKSGHSVTVLKDAAASTGSSTTHVVAVGSNEEGSAAPAAAKPEHVMGGNGAPAGRGDDGRVHGPGGPAYMGRGVSCDAAHDHCLRDGVWFSVNNIIAGKQFRAVPVFEFEKKWWTWRGEPADDPVKLYKTQIAGNAKLSAGTPVIWFSNESSETKWADSEYEALVSSRWEAGVVEEMVSPTTVMIKGSGTVPMDTVRLITETRGP